VIEGAEELARLARGGIPRRVVLGLSGGADSVAMLHWLVAGGLEVVTAHYHHAWHPDEARHAAFCDELARGAGLEFHRGEAPEDEPRTEDAARQARYAFLESVATETGCDAVVTAHTADDQAETVVMQVLRGTGMTGLGGMRGDTARGAVRLLRPWLGVRRAAVRAYARGHGLAWCEDVLNADVRRRRAWVRAELMPRLEDAQGGAVVPSLCRLAAIAAAEDEFMAAETERARARAAAGRDPARLAVSALAAEPVALQRRVIRAWLLEEGVGEVGFEVVEQVRRLLGDGGPAKVNLAGDRHARRTGGRLWLTD
jgi:tRNA(Ile)-lysidine synthase